MSKQYPILPSCLGRTMPNHSDVRNARNKTTLSLSLAILIIIMDMSGLAGLAAQEELEEVQEKRETLSGLNIPGFQKGLVNSSVTFDIGENGIHACAILSDGEITTSIDISADMFSKQAVKKIEKAGGKVTYL